MAWPLEEEGVAQLQLHHMGEPGGTGPLSGAFARLPLGPLDVDPEAVAAFFKGLAPGSRVAVIPEGPYVLASAGAA